MWGGLTVGRVLVGMCVVCVCVHIICIVGLSSLHRRMSDFKITMAVVSILLCNIGLYCRNPWYFAN